MHTTPQTPLGALFDFGGTLCREEDFDLEAGAASIVALAETTNGLTAEALAELLRNMMEDLLPRREASQLELPTSTALRLVYEPNGLTFRNTQKELELTFWKAATTFTPEPGIEDLLAQLTSRGVPIGVVSNTMFSSKAIRWELEQHGLAHFFQFIMTSAEYVVRKPHPMIEAAPASRSKSSSRLRRHAVSGRQLGPRSRGGVSPGTSRDSEWADRAVPCEADPCPHAGPASAA